MMNTFGAILVPLCLSVTTALPLARKGEHSSRESEATAESLMSPFSMYQHQCPDVVTNQYEKILTNGYRETGWYER